MSCGGGAMGSGMHASGSCWNSCSVEVGGVILTCQNIFPGWVCDGKTVIYPCSGGHNVSRSAIYCGDEVFLIGELSLGRTR